MTEYTREEVYKAHDALEYLIQNLYDVSLEEAKDTDSYKKLVKFLPPKPKPTMAHMAWNDYMHYMAEASHAVFGYVYMLEPEEERIKCLHLGIARHEIISVCRGDLTPTGKRYKITEE